MIGVLAIHGVLLGLALAAIGRASVPAVGGLVLGGGVLIAAAPGESRRCLKQRRVIRGSVVFALLAGLVLVDLPLFAWLLVRAMDAAPGRPRVTLVSAALLSVVLLVVLPVLAVVRVRHRRTRYRLAARARRRSCGTSANRA